MIIFINVGILVREYIKELYREAMIVFPKAEIHFILPFSSIKDLGQEYVRALANSIKDAGVNWRIHTSPAMKGKLQAAKLIHLTKEARPVFTQWLKKICTFEQPVSASAHLSSPSDSSRPCGLPNSGSQANVGVGNLSAQPGANSQCPGPSLWKMNCLHGMGRGTLTDLVRWENEV